MSTLQQLFSIICLYCVLMPNIFAASINPGDLLISEVMANPAAVSDSNGEWFEIFNASLNLIDLNALTISDDGSNSHIINADRSLLITPGEYFVLSNNGDSGSNGGFMPDYVYSGFSLANSSDQIIILDDGNEIFRLEYSGAPFGVTGVSAELINQVLNPQADDYGNTPTDAVFQYGDGDFGTPGGAGSVLLTTRAPVPLPGATWLFGSAFLLFLRNFLAPATCHKLTFNL